MRVWHLAPSLLIVAVAASAGAWPLAYPTGVTVYEPDKTFNGYTLFLAIRTKQVFLVDMEGNIRQSWQTSGIRKAEYAELLPDNHVLVGRGPLTEYDWEGNEVWKVEDPERNVSTSVRHLHVGISVVWTRFASSFLYTWGPAPTPAGFSEAWLGCPRGVSGRLIRVA